MPMIEVVVLDDQRNVLKNAAVTLQRDSGELVKLAYDSYWEAYLGGDEVKPGIWTIRVKASGYEPQQREVDVLEPDEDDEEEKDITTARFILGKLNANIRYYYRGGVKVPFEPRDDLVAVATSPRLTDAERFDLMNKVSDQSGLPLLPRREILGASSTPGPIGEVFVVDGVFVLVSPNDLTRSDQATLQAMLEGFGDAVRQFGPPVHLDTAEESVSFVTHQIIVKLNDNIRASDLSGVWSHLEGHLNESSDRYVSIDDEGGPVRSGADAGAESDDEPPLRLSVVRRAIPDTNAFVLQANLATYDLLDICESFRQSHLVDFAELNLGTAGQRSNAITPADFLLINQWYLMVVEAVGAWRQLRTLPRSTAPGQSGDLTYGSEDIIIAIMDEGIEENHPDLLRKVTGCKDKVYKAFDFRLMEDNNNRPGPSGHGMMCAGMAAANANDEQGAFIGGGMVGAAPNCRVMGLIRPAVVDTAYSDAYLWIAGFDPDWHSDTYVYPEGGTPAPLNRGADIISNSFSDMQSEVSDTMKLAFRQVTNCGRDGRGVVLIFSVGNRGKKVSESENLWATNSRTIAVAASTWDNKRDSNSNYGRAIDFCAPSDGVSPQGSNKPVISCHLQGTGNWVGAPTAWTTLTNKADPPTRHPAQATLQVTSSAGFANHPYVLIGDPITGEWDGAALIRVVDGTNIEVGSFNRRHAFGDTVITGPADYTDGFGGTSAAAALAAGVAALVLSANPDLRWNQVRGIMRRTAEKINFPKGWITTSKGKQFSKYYGYGRINARRAVREAANVCPKAPFTPCP